MNLIRAAAVIFACATKHPSANALELIQAQEGTRIEGKYIVTLKDEEGFDHMSQAKMSRMIQKRARRIAKDVHGNLEGVYTNSIHGFIAKLSQDAVNILLNDTRIAMVEEAVASKLLANPATNTISNAGSGTPNRMLLAYGEIKVLVHIEGIGNRKSHLDTWAGTFGQSRRLEGFKISRFYGYTDTIGSGISIEYMAHLEGSGDTTWTSGYVGSMGQSRRLEGFAIRLKGVNASQWSVRYSAHLQDYGDTPTVRDGAFCGTRGESRRVEAILVDIVRSYHW